MTGIELIAKERQEQIKKHGRTINNDIAENTGDQLRKAACGLLIENASNPDIMKALLPINWDEKIWFKMCKKPLKERLIIAGALIAAELDRINN